MDARCQEKVDIIVEWVEALDRAEEIFMNLEASEEALWATVFLEQKEGSIETKKALTNKDPRVVQLREAIAQAKRAVLKAKRMHEVALKAGDWEYGTLKRTEEIIRRQRGA